jgi:hypothetical protein
MGHPYGEHTTIILPLETSDLTETHDHVLMTTVEILGQRHFLMLVRVDDEPGEDGIRRAMNRKFDEDLERLEGIHPGCTRTTVKVSADPGDWVCYLHPHG